MKKSTLLFISALLFNLNTSAQYSWQTVGDTLNLSVKTILSDTSSSFYIGGAFTKVGVNDVAGIARWTGTSWNQIAGSGIIGTEVGSILHMDGGIVAGGTFTSIDSVNCNNVAFYDGSSWSPIGSGLDYTGGITVSTLTIYEEELYAGGTFVTSDGDTLNNIAKWNGSAWVALGSGINGTVSSLCVYNGKLYAGGTFTNAGGVSVNNIASWNGSTWSDVDGGVAYTGGITVSTMTVYNDELYIGGTFQLVSGDSIDNIARWNDTAWSSLGNGMRYTGAITVSTLTFHEVDKFLIVSGKYQMTNDNSIVYQLQSWDATNWELLDAETDDPVYSVADVNEELFVGGAFKGIGGDQVNYLGAWLCSGGRMYNMLTQEQQPEQQMCELYPNPVADNLYMKLIDKDEMSQDEFTFTLTDLLGRIVSSVTIKGSDLRFQRIGIPAGIYYYDLMNVNKNTIQKGKVVFR